MNCNLMWPWLQIGFGPDIFRYSQPGRSGMLFMPDIKGLQQLLGFGVSLVGGHGNNPSGLVCYLAFPASETVMSGNIMLSPSLLYYGCRAFELRMPGNLARPTFVHFHVLHGDFCHAIPSRQNAGDKGAGYFGRVGWAHAVRAHAE
jgi:hypothetical protein